MAEADELPDNWGRWGEDDESGTLNLITDAGRGVLLDLAADGPLPGGPVTGRDLDAAEEREGVTLESGDALVLRGGRTVKDDPPVPGVSVDAVRWMHRRRHPLTAYPSGLARICGTLPPTISKRMNVTASRLQAAECHIHPVDGRLRSWVQSGRL